MVAITSPVAGFVGTQQQTVSWTVQSATATTFTSRIFYSVDGGTTWLQLDELTGTTDIIDFSMLPGATTALLRIDASDGVNTGSATSVTFNVPKKLPSTIVINTPAIGYAQAAADPVFLSGAAYDADDGVLTGAALQWSDSLQGPLGSGSNLTVNLNPGSHTISLTATDSDGNAITATTNITLGGGRPIVTLSTNTLASNCVSATIAAIPGNQGAPLSSVQYSLNGGATYASVPLTQLPYSLVVPGASTVNLIAVASDISRQAAAKSTLVALTGACSTGVPTLSGGSSQTTPVGSAFSTPLSTLVSDLNGNPVQGVVVNFTVPANGASATLSPASATSNSSGIASTTATANGTNGSYNVVATVPGFSTTAQFSLTNTDFTLGLNNSSLAVVRGSTATATITITPLSGFTSTVTLACTGLPVGVTCSFNPATLTPSGSAITSTLTVTAAKDVSTTSTAMRWGLSSSGIIAAFCFFIPGFRRRRKSLGVLVLFGAVAVFSVTTGCSNFKPFTSTVSVTATTGTLQHASTINLSVN
jgi:hypothetical protein